MQSLPTDVLILFNAMEPVKMVQKIILNSTAVQTAFKESCFMLTAEFTNETNLVDGKDPICYLYRFLIQGFIRVYSKDIYQLRLSNVLLSKTGASGIRTNLLTLSGISEKNKKISSENTSANSSITLPSPIVQVTPSSTYVCTCKKEYKLEGWYKRHIMSCSTYNLNLPIDNAAVHLDNLLELECLEQLGDFDLHADEHVGIRLESALEKEENEFDANFISNILHDDV